MWYVAFRSGSSRVMFLYPDRESAIEAARRVLTRGQGVGLEVAPVARSADTAPLTVEDIRRLCAAGASEPPTAERLRSLAAWYRDYAEQAGEPHIWEGRRRTAEKLEREADRAAPREAAIPAPRVRAGVE